MDKVLVVTKRAESVSQMKLLTLSKAEVQERIEILKVHLEEEESQVQIAMMLLVWVIFAKVIMRIDNNLFPEETEFDALVEEMKNIPELGEKLAIENKVGILKYFWNCQPDNDFFANFFKCAEQMQDSFSFHYKDKIGKAFRPSSSKLEVNYNGDRYILKASHNDQTGNGKGEKNGQLFSWIEICDTLFRDLVRIGGVISCSGRHSDKTEEYVRAIMLTTVWIVYGRDDCDAYIDVTKEILKDIDQEQVPDYKITLLVALLEYLKITLKQKWFDSFIQIQRILEHKPDVE
ncbi:hypothetical protein Ciccas_014335 [Cichlidogyrus casuarinus]|uniref:Uncharacterized protein n=1 Tax=Cichlidogyrus casuarinus TaxID=1844966 RepID=A0ABD2PJQ0_9PLAT